MFKLQRLYLAVIFSLTFGACQKTDVVGGKDYATLGSSAHDLLAAAPHTALKIQIQYMPGFQPDNQSIDNLKSFLNQYLNKPDGINITEVEIPSAGKSVLTVKDVVNIEKKYRTVFTDNHQIAVHILITDGISDKSDIFGSAYWNTSICLFGKTISDNSGTIGRITRSQLFSVLFDHEFGHLLGLVNQGSPMQTNHQDVANGAHCINKNCLMHYDIETAAISPTSSLPSLDANCVADLKANGGK
ncbi:MAG: M12 family metallo-peptidase [Ginsengibacter sp.]